MNIAKEYQEYFEENREREIMRKAGVDVDNLPRRTSTVVDRFQEGMKAQEALAKEQSGRGPDR